MSHTFGTILYWGERGPWANGMAASGDIAAGTPVSLLQITASYPHIRSNHTRSILEQMPDKKSN